MMLSNGYTYRQIAAFLWITEETVKQHAKTIRKKLGAANSVEAVAVAIRTGQIA